MAKTMSKTFKTKMVIVVQITKIVSDSIGTIIAKNILISPAPSIRAASIISLEIDRSAAEKITIANPVWIQTIMNIRKKLFQKGIAIQA